MCLKLTADASQKKNVFRLRLKHWKLVCRISIENSDWLIYTKRAGY